MPGLLELIEGDPAQRPLPGARDPGRRERSRMSALRVRAAGGAGGARAARGARPGPRRTSGCWSPTRRRRRSSMRASTSSDSCSSPAICWWSTFRRRSPAAMPAPARRRRAGRASTSPPRRRSSTTAGGSSSCAATDGAPPGPRPGAASRSRFDGGAGRSSSSRRTRPARGCCWRGSTAPAPVDDLLAAHGEPIRYGYVRAPLAAGGLPERVRDDAGQRRDAQRRTSVHRPADHALVARGISIAPITLHAGVSSPERHEPPFPERSRCPLADRAAGRRGPRLAAGA